MSRRGVTTTGAAALLVCLTVSPTAAADPAVGRLNGRYVTTSNGEWAKTNEQYRDEMSVQSTWTISTTCSGPNDCTGTISSDQGWSAGIYEKSGLWYVRRAIPGWQPCPDGTAADGLQMFRFYAGDPETGRATPGSDTYLGEDITSSPSGACGINKQLVITLPFKMVPA
jgi:hypothetical protein